MKVQIKVANNRITKFGCDSITMRLNSFIHSEKYQLKRVLEEIWTNCYSVPDIENPAAKRQAQESH